MFRNLSVMRGARVAVETCMNVKPDEDVLVVTDTKRLKIAEAFVYASSALEAQTVIAIMEPSKQSREPPRAIAEAMKAVDVALLPTSRSLSHTDARREATKRGVRIASMPNITKDMMSIGGLTADYKQVAEITNRVAQVLEKGEIVRITTPSGTSITMSIKNRPPLRDTGLYHKKGEWGNLPAGEVCLAPVEGTTQGTLVIDSMGVTVAQPLKILVKDGWAREFVGPDATKLEAKLKAAGRNAFNIGELGIGTNSKARITGAVLEDEKVLGTVHIALGDNTSYAGGHTKSRIHLDGILFQPSLWVDKQQLLKAGNLLV